MALLLYALRNPSPGYCKDSPIVLAHGEKGSYCCIWDIIAYRSLPGDVTVHGDNELAVMEPDGISHTDVDGNLFELGVMVD